MEDVNGKAYAQHCKIKLGDKLQVDSGFTCVEPNSIVTICSGKHGLYFPCKDGQHYLDGQTDADGDTLIGLYPA